MSTTAVCVHREHYNSCASIPPSTTPSLPLLHVIPGTSRTDCRSHVRCRQRRSCEDDHRDNAEGKNSQATLRFWTLRLQLPLPQPNLYTNNNILSHFHPMEKPKAEASGPPLDPHERGGRESRRGNTRRGEAAATPHRMPQQRVRGETFRTFKKAHGEGVGQQRHIDPRLPKGNRWFQRFTRTLAKNLGTRQAHR